MMRIEPAACQSTPGGDAWGAARRGVALVRVSLYNRQAAALLVVALVALAWLAEMETWRGDPCMRLVRGDVEVQTRWFALSPDGTKAATTDTIGRVALWDRANEWRIERFLPFPGFAWSVVFSPDGRLLAVAGVDGPFMIWDLTTNTSQVEPFRIHGVANPAFSTDGRTVALWTDRHREISLWDLTTGRVRQTFKSPAPILRMAFSPNGRYLAAGGKGNDPEITIWDRETGGRSLRLRGIGGPVMALAFSPDGALLAAAGNHERCIRIWDLKTARLCLVIAGHSFSATSLAFSPDGTTLASCGNDGMIRLWTMPTGRPGAVLDGGATNLCGVAFTPDGHTLVAASSYDNHLRLWELGRTSPEDNGLRQPNGDPDVDSASEKSKNPNESGTIFLRNSDSQSVFFGRKEKG
jgi:WD40 repeat protein